MSEYILTLQGNSLYSCPIYWQNFVYDVNPTGGNEDQVDIVLMEKYDAEFVEGREFDEVIFPDLETYVSFLLEWS